MTQHDSDPDLPNLAPDEEQRLAALLRNAVRPMAIERARHERLLWAALEDPFAPASAEELIESERLRQALAGEDDHLDLTLARGLAAAYAPGALPAPQSLELSEARPAVPLGKLYYIRFGAGALALAAAAAVVLAVSPQAREVSESAADLPTLVLARSRSTAPLFRVDFEGAPSARIDRIASARGRELRDNRYALWGVR
jgi:hypothetical protein